MSAAQVTARWVDFPSIGGTIRGYLALPSGARARPAAGRRS